MMAFFAHLRGRGSLALQSSACSSLFTYSGDLLSFHPETLLYAMAVSVNGAESGRARLSTTSSLGRAVESTSGRT